MYTTILSKIVPQHSLVIHIIYYNFLCLSIYLSIDFDK